MVYNKYIGDIVYYLDYHTQLVNESRITYVRLNGNYNIVTATGKNYKDVQAWHLYNTKVEAIKQSLLTKAEEQDNSL